MPNEEEKGRNESSTVERLASRRDLLRTAALGVAAFSVPLAGAQSDAATSSQAKTMIGVPFEPLEVPRMGLIGCGNRGTNGGLPQFLHCDNLRVTAVCDPLKNAALSAQDRVVKAGQSAPAIYSNGDHDYENLVNRDDVDFVYIAVPWNLHAPIALAALEHGKHVLVEVPGVTTIEDCWKLVDASERTRRHCIMTENCCFGYNELLVLNIVRDGLLGDLLHGEGAYLHDLRRMLFTDAREGLWRRFPHIERNGNFYPTHGLGPVANYMGINRGDRFDYVVSMSSGEFGLDQWREAHLPKGSPKWKEKYICGDMNTSLIKTANGRTITLSHDVVDPRPYSRVNAITGSKGLFQDFPPRIYIERADHDEKDLSKVEQMVGEDYTSIDQYKARYEHGFWKRQGEMAAKFGGHGGMDFVMAYRFVEWMHKGLVPDMDVYDLAAWSAPGPLSEASVARGSAPVKFPDFTRGLWKQKRPAFES